MNFFRRYCPHTFLNKIEKKTCGEGQCVSSGSFYICKILPKDVNMLVFNSNKQINDKNILNTFGGFYDLFVWLAHKMFKTLTNAKETKEIIQSPFERIIYKLRKEVRMNLEERKKSFNSWKESSLICSHIFVFFHFSFVVSQSSSAPSLSRKYPYLNVRQMPLILLPQLLVLLCFLF